MESNFTSAPHTTVRPHLDCGNQSASTGPARTRWRTLRPSEITRDTLAQWQQLEQHALQPNAFLSPHFILPAARHLSPDLDILLVIIERLHNGNNSLIGIGAFNRRPPNKQIPFAHLASYRSDHTFTAGLLLDRDYAEAALRELLNFLTSPTCPWHGLAFHDLIASGPVFDLMLAVAAEHKLKWFEIDRFERPALIPELVGQHYLEQQLRGRHKNLRRRLNNLQKQGSVRWQVIDGEQPFQHSIEKFLELEHSSWKGQQGGSFQSRPGHSDFFRSMATQFLQARQAFFTELTLDEHVVSSTFNLLSGNVGFAFKIAWHPAYEKFSPGLLNEVELIRACAELWPHLSYIDSCTAPGSYLEDYWKERKTVVSGVLATTRLAHYLASTREYLREHKQKIKGWLRSLQGTFLLSASTFFGDTLDTVTSGLC